MKKINKTLINLGIIAIIFVVLVGYMIIADGTANMINVVKKVELKWALVGLLCIFLYWFFEACSLHVIYKNKYKNQKFLNSFKLTMIAQFFNNITPFSTGGQPAQLIEMVKSKRVASDSAAILLAKFIVFQAVHVIYTAVILIFKFKYFKSILNNFVDLAIVGFSVNLAIIVVLILIGVNKKIVFNVLKPFYIILSKFGIISNLHEKLKKLRESTDEFHDKFKTLKNEKIVILKATFFTILQLTTFFVIAYTVYRSFEYNNNVFFDMLSAQAFLTLIMAFVPIPGAGVVAEGGFYIMFSSYFPQNEIKMAVLFWRIYTFYIPILVGGVITILFGSRIKENTNKKEIDEYENCI